MNDQSGLLPGTLDLLILKAVSLGELHGYGVLPRIERISGGALQVQQGAPYPALHRLEHQGPIESEWGVPDNDRKAEYYRLTVTGRRHLGEAAAGWDRLVEAVVVHGGAAPCSPSASSPASSPPAAPCASSRRKRCGATSAPRLRRRPGARPAPTPPPSRRRAPRRSRTRG